jgi:phage shock protein PspC (stress-responsive transcriptional regulator)
MMKNIVIERFKMLAEKGMFGVFSRVGDTLGMDTSRIRMFFIYITFLGFGSPVFIYMAVAFILNINNYIRRRRRNPIWYC